MYPSPSLVYCDNQVVVAIATNHTFHQGTKHIEIDCHFARDLINCGVLRLLLIRSAHQLADMFTKALHAAALHNFMVKMGIFDLHSTS